MTKATLKPLNEQSIVITGATSGIGLATARRAARAGACVFLREAALFAGDAGAALAGDLALTFRVHRGEAPL